MPCAKCPAGDTVCNLQRILTGRCEHRQPTVSRKSARRPQDQQNAPRVISAPQQPPNQPLNALNAAVENASTTVLGTGNYGKVYKMSAQEAATLQRHAAMDVFVENTPSSGYVAVKIAKRFTGRNSERSNWHRLQKQDAVMLDRAAKCPSLRQYVPRLYWSGMIDGIRVTCMSLAEGRDIRNMWPKMSRRQRYSAYQSLLKALDELHACNIAHGDFHVGNVLFSFNLATKSFDVTIIDFGWAHDWRTETHPMFKNYDPQGHLQNMKIFMEAAHDEHVKLNDNLYHFKGGKFTLRPYEN